MLYCAFIHLGYHSLWLDELINIRDVSNTFSKIHQVILASPPLFHYLLRVIYLVCGNNDAWLRILPALFGVLTVRLIYWIGYKLWGDKAAFWAGLLMAVSVFEVLYSQEVRMCTLVALEALVSMYVWTRAVETRDKKYWLMFGAASLTGQYTHTQLFPFSRLGPRPLDCGDERPPKVVGSMGALLFAALPSAIFLGCLS